MIQQCCKELFYSAGQHPETNERLVWQYYEDFLIKPKELKDKIIYSNINSSNKKIICVNTGEVFDSISKAAKKYNIHRQNLSKCCNKEIKSCGYDKNTKEYLRWAFYDDYIKNPDKYNKENTKRKYKVLCVETNKIYETIKKASNDTGINYKSISKVCNGKRNTAGNYHWKYIK